MKRALLVLAVLACIGSIASAQTYRPLTGTRVILSTSYPSGNALTLQANPTSAYTLTLPAASPTAGDLLRSDPTSANTLIWTSPLDMYVFENGLTESGSNTIKWGGTLTGATIINTDGANAITFYNNAATTTATMTIGGGAGTLTLDVQGGTTINASGSSNTAIGNANGTFTLLSSTGLNATTAGVISDGDGNLVIADNVEPSVHDNYSMGTNAARWSDVFVGPSTVHIGSTTAGGDELALSYNTTSNTAIFNVGSTNAMELTSTTLTLAANLSANGDVTLGDGGADLIVVNSTTGLEINSGVSTNLTINEAQVTRDNTLTLQGANGTTPANVSSITLGENMTLNSSAGGIDLTANGALETQGATNTMKGYASGIEYSEIDLTSTAVTLRVETGASNPTVTVTQLLGSGIITMQSDNLQIESSTIAIGDALSDVATMNATLSEQYPLYFEGATSDAVRTRFEITDPTVDRTITFPDIDGTVITTGNTGDLSALVWLVGGNTITGSSTTQKVGLAPQAANPDALAIMTDGTDRLTISAAGAATFSGELTSTGAFTANDNATLGDGGDNISINAGTGTFEVASAGVNISTLGAISGVTTLSMSSTLTNTATSNQIVLGTTNTTTVTATAPAASVTYTIPDVGGAASFVMTAGAQTIDGAKTFSSDLAVSSNTASSSTTTGALMVTGGVGVGGAVNIGDALDVAGATTLDDAVTLGDGGADAIIVNSTSGLEINTGASTDLTIDETQVVRANTLTIQGANGSAPANVSSITLSENMTLNANAGGIGLTAYSAMETQGVTNTLRGYASGTEYAEVDLTSTTASIRVENGATDPTITVSQSLGLGAITLESDNLTLESANITIDGTIAGATPLVFDGNTAADGFETSFEITDPTADRTITFPDADGTVITTGNLSSITGFVTYNTTTTLSTADADGFSYLLDVAYDGSPTGDALGARIVSSAVNIGVNADATGLTIQALADGSNGIATGITVSASGGDQQYAIDVTGGIVRVAGGAPMWFDGQTTGDAIGLTFAITDPQAFNKTITFPDESGTVVLTAGAQTITGQKMFTGQFPMSFDGLTDDGVDVTSFEITDPTADRTITFPDADGTVITTGNLSSITGFVTYNTTTTLSTADADGNSYLLDVAYDGAATGNALGARIASDATGGTNATATGLTLSAVGTGTGAATGLTVSASGGTTNKAINVTAGGIDVDAGGINVDAGGVTVAAGGLTVTAGLSTFSQGMRMPVTVATAAATYVADDDDMVIIQTAVQQVTLPTGADGRFIIVKNTSGSDITLSADGTDTFEGALATINQTSGTSQTFIFSGGVWYLIGN